MSLLAQSKVIHAFLSRPAARRDFSSDASFLAAALYINVFGSFGVVTRHLEPASDIEIVNLARSLAYRSVSLCWPRFCRTYGKFIKESSWHILLSLDLGVLALLPALS